MFYGCSSLTSLNLSNFNTSGVTDMGAMFRSCSSLTSLDLSNFDTSSVTNMMYMFCDCSSLISLDVSNFNTSSVKYYMSYMFDGCSSLYRLVLSENFKFLTDHGLSVDNWVKVKNADGTFTGDTTKYTAAQLTALDSTTTPSIGGTWQVDTTSKNTFSVIIPKQVILDGETGDATYQVSVKGDTETKTLSVQPEDNFTLTSEGGKTTTCTVTQEKTTWNPNSITDGSTTSGQLHADLSAGTWVGAFLFTIALTNQSALS